MTKLVQAIWPYLWESAEDRAIREESDRTDIAAIKDTVWKRELLEQARCLTALENERRRAAETKASIYLAVLAAIVPILSALGTDFYGASFSGRALIFQAVTLFLFIVGLAYLLASGVWAFKTLAVSAHYRVDVSELVEANKEADPESVMVRELMLAVRWNREGVNKKTSYIKLTHSFIVRTFMTFTSLLGAVVLWDPLESVARTAAGLLAEVVVFVCQGLN